MIDKTVTPAEPADQPETYGDTVAELRRIADVLEALETLPPGEGKPWLSLSLLLDTTEGVDAAALAVLGKPAATSKNGGAWYHVLNGSPKFGRGHLAVQTTVPSPHQAELEKLRAENAKLRAAVPAGAPGGDDGLGYSREADDPTPVSPARVPLHTGGVVGPIDGGTLVDETQPAT